MILDNINWKFGVMKFKTTQDFNTAWKEYTDMMAPELKLDPNATAMEYSKIMVEYTADWKEENNEVQIEIKSQYDEPLKLGEILYTLNTETFNFFEGVEFAYFQGLEADDLEEDTPVFKMVISD